MSCFMTNGIIDDTTLTVSCSDKSQPAYTTHPGNSGLLPGHGAVSFQHKGCIVSLRRFRAHQRGPGNGQVLQTGRYW